MIEEDEPPIIDEEQERAWRAYLLEFKEDVYPIFAAHSISLDTALLVWWLNRVVNRLPEVEDA